MSNRYEMRLSGSGGQGVILRPSHGHGCRSDSSDSSHFLFTKKLLNTAAMRPPKKRQPTENTQNITGLR